MDKRIARRTVLALTAAAIGLVPAACQNAAPTGPSAMSAASAPSFDKGGSQAHFNEKFEFTDVDLGDGSTGTIRAASKSTNKGLGTTCSYFTPAEVFLGQFESMDFASQDADAVLAFCQSHFGDRS